jgi:hypothetical protein
MKGKKHKKHKKPFLWSGGSCPGICVVVWKDPCSPLSKPWLDPQEVSRLEPLDCVAAGLVIAEDEEKITLASSACPSNGNSGGQIIIPKKIISFQGKLDVGITAREER